MPKNCPQCKTKKLERYQRLCDNCRKLRDKQQDRLSNKKYQEIHKEELKEKRKIYLETNKEEIAARYRKNFVSKRKPKRLPVNPDNKICNHCRVEKTQDCFSKNTPACKACRSEFNQKKNEIIKSQMANSSEPIVEAALGLS